MGSHCPNCGVVLDRETIVSWGGWTLNEETRFLKLATGEDIRLVGLMMVASVGALIRAQGRVVTHDHLYGAMYALRPEADQPEMKSVDVSICKLRKLSPTIRSNILTIWGRGFHLKEIQSAADQGVRDQQEEAREAPPEQAP